MKKSNQKVTVVGIRFGRWNSIPDNYSSESICYFILPVLAFIASLLPSAVLMVTGCTLGLKAIDQSIRLNKDHIILSHNGQPHKKFIFFNIEEVY